MKRYLANMAAFSFGALICYSIVPSGEQAYQKYSKLEVPVSGAKYALVSYPTTEAKSGWKTVKLNICRVVTPTSHYEVPGVSEELIRESAWTVCLDGREYTLIPFSE